MSAMVPSGTTFSSPVNAVPAGETVVPRTVVPSGRVVEDEGRVTVVPLTVVPVVDELDEEVVDVLEPPGVVVELVVCVVLDPEVVVDVAEVVPVVVVSVSVVVVGVVVLSVVVVSVVVGVVVLSVVVVSVVVLVDVVPPVQ